MKLRADLERITVDSYPNLMQARPDDPLCRGYKHTSALERTVMQNLLNTLWTWPVALLQVVRSVFWHAFEHLRMISTNLLEKEFLAMFCWVAFALLMVPWPLQLSRSKAVGSQVCFLFTSLAAVHVSGWDKNSFGKYSYLCSVLWQSEETPLLNDASN